MSPRTRRDVLRATGGLAGLGTAASIAGCGIFGGSGTEGSDADSPAADVPDRAGALLSVDFQALRETESFVDAANAELGERGGANSQVPPSVTAALDGLAGVYDLDPRQLNRALAFVGRGAVETPTETPSPPYWGVVGDTDWGREEMLRSFRNAAPARVREATHAGTTVLGIGPEHLAVLGDGKVVLGSETAVRDGVDVANGTEGGVGGRLRSAFDAASGQYVRFGVDLDMAAVAARVLGQQAVDAVPFSAIRYVRGSVFEDGDRRGLRVVTKLGSAGKAEQLSAQVDSFVGIARAQGLDRPALQPYEGVIRGLETTTDGKLMRATYRADDGEFAAVVGHVLASFLVGIRKQ
ncbi:MULTISPECIES: hypothetical protein [Salinibaculum]|uniref:hypothetical protein n=1 Tax=Salinibaculum TaxID=2732368 RepID=UPI0030D3EE04